MKVHHSNGMNVNMTLDEKDVDHISPDMLESEQRHAAGLSISTPSSPLVVSNRRDEDSIVRHSPHMNDAASPSQPHPSYGYTDYSITNCGSNTPMMTHCPNFYNHPSPHATATTTTSPSVPNQMSTTPPFFSLPLPLIQSQPITNSAGGVGGDNTPIASNELFLPSLFSTIHTTFRNDRKHQDTTTTKTTADETTPLWSRSTKDYAKHDDNDAGKDGIQKRNHMSSPQTATVDDKTNMTHPSNSISICILYGMINATIVIPVVLTFTTIIYSHPIYHPYLPILTQCTLFSSLVHQIIFSTLSSLPFAIGQVQDAGLIFLSNMATQLAVHYTVTTTTTTTTTEMEHLIPTTMMALSVSTLVLGIALVLIGHYRLAQYVQLLPTCVVGGYLAYIGYFCGKAGILMMLSSIPNSSINNTMIDPTTGSTITTASVTVLPKLYYVVPGIVGGMLIYMAIRRIKYMITLPVCIMIEMILFYLVLCGTNTSIHDATLNGWIRSTDHSSTITMTGITENITQSSSSSSYMWYHTWDFLLQFQNVDWYIMLKLIPNLIGMIFVVTLSSSLDITAIEIELRQQYQVPTTKHVAISAAQPEQQPSSISVPSLNYNSELQMIGVSNIISGCFGGYTGSYIFSQSIFSLRAGIRSRLAGYVLALCEFIIFVLPIPILSYVPNFLFASLLIMICIDLIIEWLWDVRHRLTHVEYILCLSTFVLIQSFNVEYGILAGILLYVFIQQVVGWDVGSSTKSMNKFTENSLILEESEVNDLLLNESQVVAK